jgi:hypothetical protein
MKKLLLLGLMLVAFITFSFKMVGTKKTSAVKEDTSSQSGGFSSIDPIN